MCHLWNIWLLQKVSISKMLHYIVIFWAMIWCVCYGTLILDYFRKWVSQKCHTVDMFNSHLMCLLWIIGINFVISAGEYPTHCWYVKFWNFVATIHVSPLEHWYSITSESEYLKSVICCVLNLCLWSALDYWYQIVITSGSEYPKNVTLLILTHVSMIWCVIIDFREWVSSLLIWL